MRTRNVFLILITSLVLIISIILLARHRIGGRREERLRQIESCVASLGTNRTEGATIALQDHGADAVPYLEPLLYEKDEVRRDLALKIVIEINCPESANVLRAYLRTFDDVGKKIKIIARFLLVNEYRELLWVLIDAMKDESILLAGDAYFMLVGQLTDGMPEEVPLEMTRHRFEGDEEGTPHPERLRIASKWEEWLGECFGFLRYDLKKTFFYDSRTGDDSRAVECLKQGI